MRKLVALGAAAVLALTLTACEDDIKSKKATNYKTPTATASKASTLKEGDRCKKKGATATAANGRKLVCKRTTSGSYLRWRYA